MSKFNIGDHVRCVCGCRLSGVVVKFYDMPTGRMYTMISDDKNSHWDTTEDKLQFTGSPYQVQHIGQQPQYQGQQSPFLQTGDLVYQMRDGFGIWGADVGPSVSQLIKKCECGCASVGTSNHSDYCPLYAKE